jgi:hypothetical protein
MGRRSLWAGHGVPADAIVFRRTEPSADTPYLHPAWPHHAAAKWIASSDRHLGLRQMLAP